MTEKLHAAGEPRRGSLRFQRSLFRAGTGHQDGHVITDVLRKLCHGIKKVGEPLSLLEPCHHQHDQAVARESQVVSGALTSCGGDA